MPAATFATQHPTMPAPTTVTRSPIRGGGVPERVDGGLDGAGEHRSGRRHVVRRRDDRRGGDDVAGLVRVQAEDGAPHEVVRTLLDDADVEVPVLHRTGEVPFLERGPHPGVLVRGHLTAEDQRFGPAADAGPEGAHEDLAVTRTGNGRSPQLPDAGSPDPERDRLERHASPRPPSAVMEPWWWTYPVGEPATLGRRPCGYRARGLLVPDAPCVLLNDGGLVRTVQRAPVSGLVLVVALLTAVQTAVGLGAVGWGVGLSTATTAAALLAVGLHRTATTRFGPANAVTLVRASLGLAVAALVAASFAGPDHRGLLVALTAVALALDAVDGRVARRTGSVTPLGARFDMEADAFLILVLSVAAGPICRLVGPRHRVRPVCAPAGRADLAVAPGSGAAAVLAQGGGRDPGGHPRDRRVRRVAHARGGHAPARCSGPARRVFGRDVLLLVRVRHDLRGPDRGRGRRRVRPATPVVTPAPVGTHLARSAGG